MKNDDVIALRRDIHRHAELGFVEYYTASRVASLLSELPVRVRTGEEAIRIDGVVNYPSKAMRSEWAERAIAAGADAERVRFFQENGTALVAEIAGARPGPIWGLRVDIDALPVREGDGGQHLPAREGFRSVTPAMHACGHDGHTAIGVAVLSRLADLDFPGTLRILFQPAEEGVRGAKPMVAAGVTEGIERMLAVHLGHNLETGIVGGSAIDAMATTKYIVNFQGVAAHAAASPEHGRNALAAAATATLGLLGIPRVSSGDTRVNVGTLNANGAANIIPESAEMMIETRGTTNEAHLEVDRRAHEIVAGAASMHGVTATIEATGGAPTMIPDEAMIDLVATAATEIDTITEFHRTLSTSGSDDANLFIRTVQNTGGVGAYLRVSSSNPGPHHSEYFDIDEDSIFIAIDLIEKMIRNG